MLYKMIGVFVIREERMVGQFSKHSTMGKVSLIFAILTITFFVLGILFSILTVVLQNLSIVLFSTIFTVLTFIFSLISIVIGAVTYWGKDRDKYGLYAFIIGLVFLILASVVQIAVAATVYVYVSGMIGAPEFAQTPSVFLDDSQTGKNCTLTIMHVSEDDVKWSDISYTLTDITNTKEIDCTPPNNEVLVSYNYEYLENGKSIFIYGGIDGSDELKTGNNYSFTPVSYTHLTLPTN